jgi:heptosyltransferase-2
LLKCLESASHFIGNDSGPGHLAAILGVPSFIIFGPQLPERFLPAHPRAQFIEGKPCRFKPCFDYCRFEKPFCLHDSKEEEVWHAILNWIK